MRYFESEMDSTLDAQQKLNLAKMIFEKKQKQA